METNKKDKTTTAKSTFSGKTKWYVGKNRHWKVISLCWLPNKYISAISSSTRFWNTRRRNKKLSRWTMSSFTTIQICFATWNKIHNKNKRNEKSAWLCFNNRKILTIATRQGDHSSNILYNAMLRLTYWPLAWKYAKIIMIQKPGKHQTKQHLTDQSVFYYHSPNFSKNFSWRECSVKNQSKTCYLNSSLVSEVSTRQYSKYTG